MLTPLRTTVFGAITLLAAVACGPILVTPHQPEAEVGELGQAPLPEPSEGLIPRAVFFGDPEKAQAQISPDGAWLSFLAPDQGVMNVWVAPSDDLAAARPVTSERARGVREHLWAYSSQHVLYLRDAGGDEHWHLHVVDVSSLEDRDLTPMEGVSAQIVHLSPSRPLEVAVGLNDRDPQLHDVHRIKIRTGERRMEIENDGFTRYLLDDTYEVRLAMRARDDGGATWVQPSDDGWQVFLEVPAEDASTTRPLAISSDGRTMTMLDSRGRDTAALFAVDLASKAATLLAVDPQADAEEVVLDPTTHAPLAWASTYTRKTWRGLDATRQTDLAVIAEAVPGELSVVSMTNDQDRWIVAAGSPQRPPAYYLYDRSDKSAALLFSSRPALEGVPLVAMHAHTIAARDGLELVAYLSEPQGAQPHPLVVLVHGGPWARDRWGFAPEHQWLASRGYAVLSVNFRGSTGLGKRLLNAANGAWAGAMHDDLLDAVDWAVARGVADPAKVCIMGKGYGGYAALVGLSFTPERFACAVNIAGPSNLVTLLAAAPPYWKPMFETLAARVGDARTEEGAAALRKRSPLTRADAIVRPLLIGQGANDPWVKASESDQIVAEMTSRGVPVTYVLFSDEGGSFAKPENRLALEAIVEAFLARHLGGTYQPIGGALDASSARIEHGAEHIPGLTRPRAARQDAAQ